MRFVLRGLGLERGSSGDGEGKRVLGNGVLVNGT